MVQFYDMNMVKMSHVNASITIKYQLFLDVFHNYMYVKTKLFFSKNWIFIIIFFIFDDIYKNRY